MFCCDTQTNHWPWQWCHGRGQFWRQWRRIRLCRFIQKLTHNIGQHVRTLDTHPLTPTYARGHRSWYQLVYSTNGALHPAQRACSYGYFRQQYHPIWKSPIQWHYYPTRHPTILSTLITYIHLSCFRTTSAMNSGLCWQCCPPSKHGQPPQGLTQVIILRAIHCIQV